MQTIFENHEQSKSARHIHGETSFRCCACLEVKPCPPQPGTCGTGYAVLPSGGLCCYTCAEKRERAELLTADKYTAYVSGDGRRLVTWSGGDLGSVSFGSRHPWSRERRYLAAYDCHGQRWHGTGAPGMWTNLRKCKVS